MMTNRKKNEKKMYITADYKSLSNCFFLMHILIYLCACTVEFFITNWKQRTNEQTNKQEKKIEIINIKNSKREKKEEMIHVLCVVCVKKKDQMCVFMYVCRKKRFTYLL
jgi:phenylalanyl-tRNA synthetase alpha subunit